MQKSIDKAQSDKEDLLMEKTETDSRIKKLIKTNYQLQNTVNVRDDTAAGGPVELQEQMKISDKFSRLHEKLFELQQENELLKSSVGKQEFNTVNQEDKVLIANAAAEEA